MSKRAFGLLGYPLGHSFSAQFFAEKFEREHIDAVYTNFEEADATQLCRIVTEHTNLEGLNVTIPHKGTVIPMLNDISTEAKSIGAVNVIKIVRNSRGTFLKGFNTDVIGFTKSLQPLLMPHHRRALVLGTGGASKAVVFGLRKLGITPQYVSRKAGENILTYEEITPSVLQDYTVVVNCTPLGMFPKIDAAPTLPYSALTPRHLLFDLVYNPLETRFLALGAQQGVTTKNGLEMLHLQALAAWEIWNDNEAYRPNTL